MFYRKNVSVIEKFYKTAVEEVCLIILIPVSKIFSVNFKVTSYRLIFFFYHVMENKFFAHFLCVTLVHINNRVESWRIFFTTTIYFIQTRSEDSFGNVWLEKILHGQTCLICYAKLLRLRNEKNFSFESAPFLPFRNP